MRGAIFSAEAKNFDAWRPSYCVRAPGAGVLRAGLSPQVILLDLMMPVMGGADFRAAQLADPSLSGIPVILLTAEGHLGEISQALRADASFSKPFDLSRLLGSIAGVVTQQQSAAA